jgi:predicted nucleic acid-binding protein
LKIYADSSFLVSIYVQDTHTPEALRRMALQPSVWFTPLNRAEIAHAIHQFVFRRSLTAHEAKRSWSEFEHDSTQGIWVPVNLPERTWETSIDLVKRFGPTLGVRTLDSLHVACALELKSKHFWTFDERQARLAEVVGLSTNS